MSPDDPFSALADEPRWVAWRNEVRVGSDKPTKVSHAPGGGKAKADDPSTWGTRQAAKSRADQIVNGQGGGIGIELGDLGADQYLAGLDLDGCFIDGVVATWAADILKVVKSYAEVSPSGGGLKIFVYVTSDDVRRFLGKIGVEPSAWGCRRGIPGLDEKDHGPAVEVYLASRYFTVTERKYGDHDRIALLDVDALDRLADLIPKAKRSTTADTKTTSTGSGDNSRSGIAFRKGVALVRGGASYADMVAALKADPETEEWVRTKGAVDGERELKRIWNKAEVVATDAEEAVTLEDFYAYMPMHSYIFTPTRAMWPAASVNARIAPIPVFDPDGSAKLDKGKPVFMPASAWLDRNRPVEQITWAPGEIAVIEDRLPVLEGGWVHRRNARTFNLYSPPVIEPGDPRRATRWIDHIRLIYPDDVDHLLDWFAHRVQHPGEKINHALVLGGTQGIGKDSLIAPVRYAVRIWNCQEVSPPQIMGRFNGYLRSTMLRISEARDLGDGDRFKFYEHAKTYTASPPEFLRVDEKNLREIPVVNCVGVIYTTNHKTDGIYLPADDRRHYVAWSDLTKEDERLGETYWQKLWHWYDVEGNRAVAAYLRERDIHHFDPKAPPPKTPAFWAIVDANRAPEEA